MALDRQSIEKKDFPVGRRGYDPEAVDAHLSALAEEIAEFKRSARRRSDTLATSASDQVRLIVEAAESSAAAIQRDAEDDAREIRDEANREAQATREQATAQAREYVGKVSESTSSMLERLAAMEGELGTLIDSLRTGGNRLSADLHLVEASLTEVKAVVIPRPHFESEHEVADEAPPEPQSEPEPEPEAEPEPEPAVAAEAPVEIGSEPPAAAAVPAEPAPGAEDAPGPAAGDSNEEAEGARLIALNMALNGTPREEAARYLSETFQLLDAGRLLDDVYASVEG